jgi:hypothetical protein
MAERIEYILDLGRFEEQFEPVAFLAIVPRTAESKNAVALAQLVIEAYRGTIDYDGESLADAMSEVKAFLRGDRRGKPLYGNF